MKSDVAMSSLKARKLFLRKFEAALRKIYITITKYTSR